MPVPAERMVILFCAALVAGAVNSVAGGGTLITFPALLWVGQTAKLANATSTVALWPGQLGSLFGYRAHLRHSGPAIAYLAAPSLVGGGAGAILLIVTPAGVFARLVPFLIIAATLLFAAQEPIRRALRGARAPDASDSAPVASCGLSAWTGLVAFQLAVSVYGGYFGAGIGILMLAAFGLMGFRGIHQMNGLKNINGLLINGVAAGLFVFDRLVDWRLGALMACAAVIGGYAGAGAAQRIGETNVRRIVILIGCGLAVATLRGVK